jgi:hypothetical protein
MKWSFCIARQNVTRVIRNNSSRYNTSTHQEQIKESKNKLHGALAAIGSFLHRKNECVSGI